MDIFAQFTRGPSLIIDDAMRSCAQMKKDRKIVQEMQKQIREEAQALVDVSMLAVNNCDGCKMFGDDDFIMPPT